MQLIFNNILVVLFSMILITGCEKPNQESSDKTKDNNQKNKKEFYAAIKMMSDKEYPDNPAIGNRSEKYNKIKYDSVKLNRKATYRFDISIYNSQSGDSVYFNDVNLYEYIPGVPVWIRDDPYLTRLCLINQEWNRQQVHFPRDLPLVNVHASEFEKQNASRFDIARNCLNAYLWELIFYSKKEGKELPYFHGWFDFPDDLYEDLFEAKNDLDYDKHCKPLEKWQEPENQKIDLTKLRTVKDSYEPKFTVHNDEMYPKKGARRKKFKNIIYPKPENIDAINDLLTDSAKFATFSKPGFYNTNDPRHTELGRFRKLENVTVRTTQSINKQNEIVKEIELVFSNPRQKQEKTTFVIGGLNFEELPELKPSQANQGWKNSMGIANHSFYENYNQMINDQTHMQSPYFAFLFNKEGKWIDSHNVGVDGPVMFLEKGNPDKLHIMPLSFERHAFIGHYVVDLKKEEA